MNFSQLNGASLNGSSLRIAFATAAVIATAAATPHATRIQFATASVRAIGAGVATPRANYFCAGNAALSSAIVTGNAVKFRSANGYISRTALVRGTATDCYIHPASSITGNATRIIAVASHVHASAVATNGAITQTLGLRSTVNATATPRGEAKRNNLHDGYSYPFAKATVYGSAWKQIGGIAPVFAAANAMGNATWVQRTSAAVNARATLSGHASSDSGLSSGKASVIGRAFITQYANSSKTATATASARTTVKVIANSQTQAHATATAVPTAYIARFASAAVSATASATGANSVRLGLFSGCAISATATVVGHLCQFGAGNIRGVATATGSAWKYKAGSGSASGIASITGIARTAIRGTGYASGIAQLRGIAFLDTEIPAHDERTARVPAEDRNMRVPYEDRTMRVAA